MAIASVMAPQLLCFAPQIFKAYKKAELVEPKALFVFFFDKLVE
jgi:hypothetical protein